MSKLFDTQTDLKLVIMTNKDLTGFVDVRLKYKDPDDVEGWWPVLIEDISNGIVSYELPIGQPLGKAGFWMFWVYAVAPSGAVSIGEAFKLQINKEGQ